MGLLMNEDVSGRTYACFYFCAQVFPGWKNPTFPRMTTLQDVVDNHSQAGSSSYRKTPVG